MVETVIVYMIVAVMCFAFVGFVIVRPPRGRRRKGRRKPLFGKKFWSGFGPTKRQKKMARKGISPQE